MNGVPLTNEQAEWAWKKWNEGYRQKDIAAAMGKCIATIHRQIGRYQDAGRTRAADKGTWRKLGELKCELK